MSINNINQAPSLPQMPAGNKAKEQEPVKVQVDKFSFTDGINHPLEAALLPSTDQVLGQAVAPFMMQGGAKVQGTVTRSDDSKFKEYINTEISSETTMDQKSGQISGETVTRASYGTGSGATYVTERGTLVTFQEGQMQAPGMTISGYVYASKDKPPGAANEDLANVIGSGGSLTQGNVTSDIQLTQQSAAFLPGADPQNLPKDIDPSTLGSYQSGNVDGVTFERVVIPDGFPNYKIIGKFGDLDEEGTLKFEENKAIIDRIVGPFKVHQEITPLAKKG